jgi:hydroxymethylpyrimidine/phosphomethylpyrimidine kinase
MKKVLTIAGSDCSGGAGIQADLKTMTAHGVYGMSAITALTAQNTTGVYGVMEATPEFVAQQLDCIFCDIRPDAVKIGMVSSSGIIEAIADRLIYHKAQNIVCDPVMVATSGARLISEDAMDALKERLLPLACVITPNLPEAEVLCGFAIRDTDEMLRAAAVIGQRLGGAVLIKGGHLHDTADDLLWTNGEAHWLRAKRVDNPNAHGTGCTLSSAIACNLALGYPLEQAVQNAKDYITGALAAGLDLGAGSGPLNHCFALPGYQKEAASQ